MEDSQNSIQIVGLIMVKNLTWCWTWQWGTNVKKKKERKKSCIQQLFSNEYSLSQAASNQWTCQGEIATFTFLPVFKVDGWDPFIHWPPQQHCGHTPLVSHTPAWLFQLFPPSTHTHRGRDGFPPQRVQTCQRVPRLTYPKCPLREQL